MSFVTYEEWTISNEVLIRRQYDDYSASHHGGIMPFNDFLYNLWYVESKMSNRQGYSIQEIICDSTKFKATSIFMKDYGDIYVKTMELYRRMTEKVPKRNTKQRIVRRKTPRRLSYYRFTDYIAKIQSNPSNPAIANNVMVVYRTADGREIPGLIELIKYEVAQIEQLFPILLQDIRIPEEWKIILSDEEVYCSYGRLTDSELVEEISRIVAGDVKDDECKSKIYTIKEILSQRRITDLLGGMYDPENREITIYYRVLNCDSKNMYLAEIRNILAHEMLHCVHHFNTGSIFSDSSSVAKSVKEALADFFCFLYCLDTDLNIWGDEIAANSKNTARERYNLWVERFDTAWPYAKALHFTNRPYGDFSEEFSDYANDRWSREKYRAVWWASHNSFIDANILLHK